MNSNYLILFVCFLLGSYGFSLFLIESPYLSFIKKRLEVKKDESWLWHNFHKLLDCYTCSGFWGGMLIYLSIMNYFIKPDLSWLGYIITTFFAGCIGSGFSTLCAYFMNWYLSYAKEKENEEKK